MGKILVKTIAAASLKLAAAGALALAAVSASALTTDYYASTSRLASGKWVKVRVTKEGVQQITYDQLRSWGFSNPERVKVYGYGGTAFCSHTFSKSSPDDIQQTLSVHTDDGRILFYGDADAKVRLTGLWSATADGNTINYFIHTVDRNYYSTAGYYLLTEDEVGGDVPEAVAYTAGAGDKITQHYSVSLYEREDVPAGNEGVIFHTKKYNAGDDISATFNIVDYATGSSDPGVVTFEIPVLYTKKNGTYSIEAPTNSDIPTIGIKCGVRNCTDGTMAFNTGTNRSKISLDDDATIADGEYTFSTTTPANSEVSYLALDRAVMYYPRKNVLHQGTGGMIMHYTYAPTQCNFVVSGATANTRVWNISSTTNVFAHEGEYDAEAGTFTGSFDHTYQVTSAINDECRLVAFNTDEQQNAVEYVGVVNNQNVHGDDTPEMVIITTDEMKSYADELADLHRSHNGMDVKVYTQQQLFDEFAAGNPTPMALRRALKMFYDRDKSKLKYLLMYGMGIYDFRGLTETNLGYDPLISFEAEPITTAMTKASSFAYINFVSDDYFGFLDDEDTPTYMFDISSKVDICVGRIPANNGAYAHDVNTKIADYLKNPLPVDALMRAVVTSDNGDSNKHLNQSLNLVSIMNEACPAMTVVQAHNLIYPHTTKDAPTLRKVVISALNKGVGLYCYNGHGSQAAFAAENIWSISLANNTDYKYAPIAMLSTCSSTNVDRRTTGVSNAMLQKNNGGAIGVIGAARTVYLEDNKYICDALVSAYSTASGPTAIGELYRSARNVANSKIKTTDDLTKTRSNLMCYSLLGDPALMLNMPDKNVVINTVNGTEATANATIAVNTLKNFDIKANVTDYLGNVQTDFNGTATVTLYEAPHDVSTVIVDKDDYDATVTLDEDVLASTVVNVKNGKIDATLFVPTNVYASSADNRNRIAIVASNADGVTAAGYNRVTYIDAAEDETFAGTLPEISDLYVSDVAVVDDVVSNSPTLYAVINLGDAGLSTTNAIGGAATLMLDGSLVTTSTLPIELNADGTASMQYSLSDITDGEHQITLDVVDNAGNHVSKSITFNAGTVVDLAADKHNAHDDVVFSLSHTYTDTPECRLIIENMSGETVLSAENASFPYTWNLKDSANADVPDGFYNAYVLTSDSSTYRSTKKVNFVVTH